MNTLRANFSVNIKAIYNTIQGTTTYLNFQYLVYKPRWCPRNTITYFHNKLPVFRCVEFTCRFLCEHEKGKKVIHCVYRTAKRRKYTGTYQHLGQRVKN